MASEDTSGRSWRLFLLLTAFLTLTFLWNLLVRGGEHPSSPVRYMTMAFDLGALIGLFGLRSQLAGAWSIHDRRRNFMHALFVIGLIAGVGLFAIRFTGGSAWYTGHLTNIS